MTGRNFAIGAAVRVASLLVVLLTPVVAARILPPSGVARVMIAVSLGTMVGAVLPLGLPLSVAYFVAQVRVGRANHAQLSSMVRRAFAYLTLAMAAMLIAVGAPWGFPPGWFMPDGTRLMLLAVVVVGTARATTKVASEVNKAFGDVNTATIAADLLGPLLGVAGIFLLSISDDDVTVARVLWCLAAGWTLAVAFALWRSPVSWRAPRSAPGIRMPASVGALAMVSVLNVGIQQAHIVVSGFTLGLDDAASFTTAARLATLTGAPLMIIASVASPDIGVALHSSTKAAMRRVELRVRRLTGILFVAASALFLAYVLAGRTLLQLLFGPGYETGYVELLVLAVGPLGSLFAGVAGLTLVLSGDRRAVLRDTIVGSVVAVCAMLFGARFGGVGLALGYTAGQLLINALLLRSCLRLTGLNPLANPLEGLTWAYGTLKHRLKTGRRG